MRIALPPFETRRLDTRHGPLARQVPRLLATFAEQAGWSVTSVPVFARRDERVAHVLIDGPLKPSQLPAVDANVDVWACGRLVRADGVYDARLTLLRPNEAHDPSRNEPEQRLDRLGDVVRWFGDTMSRELDLPPLTYELPENDNALISLLFDMDARALVAFADDPSVVDREHHFRHLADTLRHDPTYTTAKDTLMARARAWALEGNVRLALDAARATANALKSDVALWLQVADAAEVAAEPTLTEEALRHLVALAPDNATHRLRYGVFLLQSSGATDAIAHLSVAAEDPERRDAARTYLGVALAATGDVDAAIVHWSDVVDTCQDEPIRAIAAENLARARGHRA